MKRKWFYGGLLAVLCCLLVLNIVNTTRGRGIQEANIVKGTNDTYGLPDNDTAYAWLAERATGGTSGEKFLRGDKEGNKWEDTYYKYSTSILEDAGIQNVKEFGELTKLGENADSFAIAYTTTSGEFVICNYGKDGWVQKAVNPDPSDPDSPVYTYEYNMPEE